MANGEVLWQPRPDVAANSTVSEYRAWLGDQHGHTFADYGALQRWSVDHAESFWRSMWQYGGVIADAEPETFRGDEPMPGTSWCPGAKLNLAEQILERPEIDESAPALIWRGESEDDARIVSWAELRRSVASLASTLRWLGVVSGDCVAGYLPNLPESVIAFLAAASIGATWSNCSPDFGETAVIERLGQIEPKILFVAFGYSYGGARFGRLDVAKRLVADVPSLLGVIAVPYPAEEPMPDTWHRWADCVAADAPARYERVPFDHPLWVLYTSGTTGPPKGIVHGHGGVILSAIPSLALHLDLKPDDRLFWFSTTGWVVWNIVICSLMFVESVVLYDGSPVWPGLDRLWQLRSETAATIFGISGAYLGQCAKEALQPAAAGLADGMRGLIYTGSAVAPECFDWVYDSVGEDVWFSSVTGGTDVGCSFFFAGCITEPVRRGEFQCLGLGMPVDCFDEHGSPVRDEPGELVVTAAIPSMPVRLWNDADGLRYRQAYFDGLAGVWTHGDLAEIRSSGGAVIYGRSDATINRNGVRIGAAEIYRVVERMPEIADSLVIDLSGVDSADLLLFVAMTAGVTLDPSVESAIRSNLRESLSPRHAPDRIVALAEIPKTKNGKKLEVPIRRILSGVAVDVAVNRASVANPDALDDIAMLVVGHAG